MTAYTKGDGAAPTPPTANNTPDIAEIVGARTRALRATRALSRRALAAQAGVSERYLSMLEKGSGNVSIQLLDRIAHALGVRLAELVTEPDPPAPAN